MGDWGLLVGLISIALGLFFGLFFGLWGFRRSISGELSTIKDAVVAIGATVEKTWDLVVQRFGVSGGTVVRELENLGEVRVTAEPGRDKTSYLIQIEKPILKEGLLGKTFKDPEFVRQEKEFLGQEGTYWVLSPQRIRYLLPSTDPKACTEFVTFLLKWLNSTYVALLPQIKEFEEPILT